MKTKLFNLFIACLCCLAGSAQTLSPTVIPTSGGFYSAGGVSLSWTVGQTSNNTFSGGAFILSQGFQQPEVNIITGSIGQSVACAGSTVAVPFVSAGIVDAANVFTAQLSNSTGSFASPVNIGTLSSTNSGTIIATIPSNTVAGSGYRIRVVSSNPVFKGVDNGSDITISSSLIAYTILAKEEINLKRNIVNGSIGVWQAGKKAVIHESSTVMGFVQAPVIDLDISSTIVGAQILAQAPQPSTSFRYNTMADPYSDINVPDNYVGTYSLNGNSFRKITVGKNSAAVFISSGDIYIKELVLKDADNGKTTSLLFSGNTELMIRHKLEMGKRNRFNQAGGYVVNTYVEEEDVKVGESSLVTASIDVRFKNLLPDEAKEQSHTIMTGQYIAKKVESKKWVDWNGTCGSESARVANLTNTDVKKQLETPAFETFKVNISPNPSRTGFTIRVISKNKEQVTIRVVDAIGVVRSTLYNVGSVVTFGNDLPAGIYFAEVIQGDDKQSFKLVKM